MKKTLKVLKYFIIIFFSLIVVLIVVAKLAENKIAHFALTQISKTIKAPVEIDEVDFTLLRRFPLATIELKGIRLGGLRDSTVSASSAFNADTLVSIENIFFSVKTRPLIKGEYEIVKVEIVGADFKYNINPRRIGNFDFLMDTTQAELPDTAPSAPLILDVKLFQLKNISFTYVDDSSKMKAKLFIPELKVYAHAMNDKYSGTAKGSIQLSDCNFEGTNICLMKKTTMDFNLNFDDYKVTMNEVNLTTDGAKLHATGTALIKDTVFVDLQLEGSDMDLSKLIKYAPAEMLKEYGVKQLAGIMDFKASIKGMVADSVLPQLELSLIFKNGVVATSDYPALKNIHWSGKISNGALCNNQTTSIVFEAFHFETAQSEADFAFTVTNIDHPKYNVKADMKLDMAEFNKFIPDSLVRNISGKLDIDFTTQGQLPDSIGDDFTDYVMENTKATFKLRNFDINLDDTLKIQDFSGQMVYAPNLLKINNLEIAIPFYDVTLKNTSMDTKFKGKLSDTKSLDLEIKRFHLEMGKLTADLSGRIRNLDHPSYDVQSKVSMDLAEMMKFMPDSMVESMSGIVEMMVKSSGTINLDSIEEQTTDLMFLHTVFNFDFENVSIKQPNDTLLEIKKLYGNMTMDPQRVTINRMKCYMGGIEFGMDSTEILNVYETFMQERKDKQLIMQTNMTFGTIDNAWIQAFMMTDTTATATNNQVAAAEANNIQSDSISPNQTKSEVTSENSNSQTQTDSLSKYRLLPDYTELGMPHFIIRGKARAKQIVYEKNILDDVSMLFRFSDSLYVIDECKLKTCGGNVNTSLLFDARNWNQPKVDVKNYISNLDLKQLLLANDNFGDTLLTSDKVSGTLSSEFHVRAFYMDSVWPTEKIRVKGNFTIENGKIYDYEPLVELSKSFNALGGLKELDKLEFNTLKSSVFVLNNKAFIPETDVVSSALDLSAVAMQSLGEDGDYEYHIVMHLSDVLAGKSKKLLEEQAKQNKSDGGNVERNGINLVAMDVAGNSKYGFDTQKLRDKLDKTIKRQKSFHQLLFDPTLVNFSTNMSRKAEQVEKNNNEPVQE